MGGALSQSNCMACVRSGRIVSRFCMVWSPQCIHSYKNKQQEMKAEMSKVCGNKEVRIGTGPRLEVKGRFTRELRGWLAGLGF